MFEHSSFLTSFLDGRLSGMHIQLPGSGSQQRTDCPWVLHQHAELNIICHFSPLLMQLPRSILRAGLWGGLEVGQLQPGWGLLGLLLLACL